MAQAAWPSDARDQGPFDPELKCCTYLPFLPNFTIGQLLKKDGHRTTLEEAAKRGELTPLGLLPKRNNEEVENFGRNALARCPFLGGDPLDPKKTKCTIWSERPSVCRSYFCISNGGAVGQSKWKAAELLGNQLEWTLANQILWELGFTDDEIATKSWMEWRGREIDFFMKCAEIGETLTPEPFAAGES